MKTNETVTRVTQRALERSAAFVPAGPMTSGLSNTAKSKVRERAAQGLVGRAALLQAEAQAYHGQGTSVDEAEWNTRVALPMPDQGVLQNGLGLGRELFAGMRRNVTDAEHGACTWL